jgi:hypothetical protein
VEIVLVAAEPGRSIEQFNSVRARHLGGARFSGNGALTFLMLEARSHLGRHPTVLRQLFCVVSGSGWVAGADGVRHAIHVGQAALWDAGEEHDSGSEDGMTVAVLEAPSVELR